MSDFPQEFYDEPDYITKGVWNHNGDFYLVGRFFDPPDGHITWLNEHVIEKISPQEAWFTAADVNADLPNEGEISWGYAVICSFASLAHDIKSLVKYKDAPNHKTEISLIISIKGDENQGSIAIINKKYLKYPKLTRIEYNFSQGDESIDIKTSVFKFESGKFKDGLWALRPNSHIPEDLTYLHGTIIPEILNYDRSRDSGN